MTTAYPMTTDATCGMACWHALEDVCRCSCGGANHACLRSDGTAQPIRSRRIKGAIYELYAVEAANGSCRAETVNPIYDLRRAIHDRVIAAGLFQWQELARADRGIDYPCQVKTANDSEVARWPELAGWRGRIGRPLVMWVRRDLVEIAREVAS